MMKAKNLFLITLGILLSFSSCKKDDTDLIIGDWELDNAFIKTDPESTETPNQSNDIDESLPGDCVITFKEGDTYVVNIDGAEYAKGNYSISSDKVTFKMGIFPLEMPYSLSNEILQLKYSSSPQNMIASLNFFSNMAGSEAEKAQIQLIKNWISKEFSDADLITINLVFNKK